MNDIVFYVYFKFMFSINSTCCLGVSINDDGEDDTWIHHDYSVVYEHERT